MTDKRSNKCVTVIFSREQESNSDIIIEAFKPNIIDIYCGDCPHWGKYYISGEDYPCKECYEQK